MTPPHAVLNHQHAKRSHEIRIARKVSRLEHANPQEEED